MIVTTSQTRSQTTSQTTSQTSARTFIHVITTHFAGNHSFLSSAVEVPQVVFVDDLTIVEIFSVGTKKRFKFEEGPPIYRCT